jgi:hypothetical protein
MDLKAFEHEGHRWLEGEHEGRWFALDEDGARLMIETPLYGFTCYRGATAEDFSGESVGVVNDRRKAFAWVIGDVSVDPWPIHKPGQAAARIAVPLQVAEC